jgi:benzoate 4-monooxygenase
MTSNIPWVRYIPAGKDWNKGVDAFYDLGKVSVARVHRRLENPPTDGRVDCVQLLLEAKMEKAELTVESLTQLIAGSDTISNSSGVIMYHVLTTPGVLGRLRAELAAALPEDTVVPEYEHIKNLPYLEGTVNEGMRLHSPAGLGLARVITDPRGTVIFDRHYPQGTHVSVPVDTLHRCKDIWGPDAHEFKPERWANLTDQQKTVFLPFSTGPRACIGRNIAEVELKMILATWANRYNPQLLQDSLEVHEGFLRKPLGVRVRLEYAKK